LVPGDAAYVPPVRAAEIRNPHSAIRNQSALQGSTTRISSMSVGAFLWAKARSNSSAAAPGWALN